MSSFLSFSASASANKEKLPNPANGRMITITVSNMQGRVEEITISSQLDISVLIDKILGLGLIQGLPHEVVLFYDNHTVVPVVGILANLGMNNGTHLYVFKKNDDPLLIEEVMGVAPAGPSMDLSRQNAVNPFPQGGKRSRRNKKSRRNRKSRRNKKTRRNRK